MIRQDLIYKNLNATDMMNIFAAFNILVLLFKITRHSYFDNIVEIIQILFTACSIWLCEKMHVVKETWDIEIDNSYKIFHVYSPANNKRQRKIDTLHVHYKLYKYSISWFQWWTFHANLRNNNKPMKKNWQRKCKL